MKRASKHNTQPQLRVTRAAEQNRERQRPAPGRAAPGPRKCGTGQWPVSPDTAGPVAPGPRTAGPEPTTSDPCRALLANLSEHHALLTMLVDLAQQKLHAIRAADSQALHDCTVREARVLERVLRSDDQRKMIVARLAQTLHLRAAAFMPLGAIAEKLSEPLASSLRAGMAALRNVAVELQQSNRVAALVARDLHKHIRDVFAALANANRESVGYGPTGRDELTTSQNILDAVG